jgi:hypothetical protein
MDCEDCEDDRGEDNIALEEVFDGVKLVGLIGFFLWQGWLP